MEDGTYHKIPTMLMAYTPQDVQLILDRLEEINKSQGLLLNAKKTECMVVPKLDEDLSLV